MLRLLLSVYAVSVSGFVIGQRSRQLAPSMKASSDQPWYKSDDLPAAQMVSLKWVSLQAVTDMSALTGIAFMTGADPIELLTSGTAFWLVAGPAVITFGFVWRRINRTGERDGRPPIDWDDDLVVRWLGGEAAVESIRKVIVQMTSW